MKFYLILTILLLSLLPLCAQFAGGSGTSNDPWQISTPQQLDLVRNYLGSSHASKHFILINDIDLNTAPFNTDAGWIPIGDFSYRFQGHFNGANYSINNLYINNPNLVYVGLFGVAMQATFENLVFENVNINAATYVAALVGYQLYNCHVTNCHSNGIIHGIGSVAGLVGIQESGSVINQCSSSAVISGNEDIGGLLGGQNYSSTVTKSFAQGNVTGQYNVGGLIGRQIDNCDVLESYSTGNVTGSLTGIGGLVGSQTLSCQVYNCYSSSFINGNNNTGGLVGEQDGSSMFYSYSCGLVISLGDNVGGLIGSEINSAYTQYSYWDMDTSGQANSAAGDGLSNAQMKDAANYQNWDFSTTWQIDQTQIINNGYPYLINIPPVSNHDQAINKNPTNLKIYPNPFNPATTINYYLDKATNVQITVYNAKGQKIKSLLNSFQDRGEQTVCWDGQHSPSGIYFIQIQANNLIQTKKAILLK